MVTVCEGAVVFVDIRNQVVDETVAKTRPGSRIPVAVIGKDHDERHSFIRVDKLVGDGGSAETYPLIFIIGLSVE